MYRKNYAKVFHGVRVPVSEITRFDRLKTQNSNRTHDSRLLTGQLPDCPLLSTSFVRVTSNPKNLIEKYESPHSHQ